jgi:hypothetical protein
MIRYSATRPAHLSNPSRLTVVSRFIFKPTRLCLYSTRRLDAPQHWIPLIGIIRRHLQPYTKETQVTLCCKPRRRNMIFPHHPCLGRGQQQDPDQGLGLGQSWDQGLGRDLGLGQRTDNRPRRHHDKRQLALVVVTVWSFFEPSGFKSVVVVAGSGSFTPDDRATDGRAHARRKRKDNENHTAGSPASRRSAS